MQALVLPIFDYCDVVYGVNLTKKNAKIAQKVQNSCIRFAFSLKRRDHILPYLNDVNWLNMTRRRKLHLACTIFKILQTKTPTYLYNRLQFRHDIHNYTTRHSKKLNLDRFSKSIFLSSFKAASAYCWNALPPDATSCATYNSFKRAVTKVLLHEQGQIISTHD